MTVAFLSAASAAACGARTELLLWSDSPTGAAGTGGANGGQAGRASSSGTVGGMPFAMGGADAKAGAAGVGSGVGGVGGGFAAGAAGSMAGTSSGGAGAGRPACDGSVTSDVFDPGEVYLFGLSTPGYCPYGVLASWRCPNVGAVGLDPCDAKTVRIRPSDGRLLYTRISDGELRQFACDGCPYVGPGANRYPTGVVANDTVIPTSCEVEPFGASFLITPLGDVLYRCADDKSWRDTSGTVRYSDPGRTLVALGQGDLALTLPLAARQSLVDGRVLDLESGAEVPIVGLPETLVLTMRADPASGFMIVLVWAEPTPTGVSELWTIDRTGTAAWRGTYPWLPPEVSSSPEAKLDSHGALFTIGFGLGFGNEVIARRDLDGNSEVVYTEEDAPLVRIELSELVTGP